MTTQEKTVCVKMDEEKYDTKRMIFNGPKTMTAKSGFSYDTVQIKTRNEDGSHGSLIVRTVDGLYSHGLVKGKDFTDPDKFKWQVPISLQNRDPVSGMTAPTEQQARWVENFNEIMEECIEWIMNNLDALGLDSDFQRPLLKNFSPLYYAKEKDAKTGKATKRIAEGAGPWLYTKTMYRDNYDGTFTFNTEFFDKNDRELDPITQVEDVKCNCQAALIVESLYVHGEKIYPQVKLYEMVVDPLSKRRVRILGEEKNCVRLTANPTVTVADTSKPPLSFSNDNWGDEEEDEDDESAPAPAPAPAPAQDPAETKPKPKIKKVIKKVAKQTQ